MKFLLLAFSLMVTCILVLYFNRVLDTGMDTSSTATEKLNAFNKALSESDITMYDGIEVEGSDVVNFIKKNLGSYKSTEEAHMYVHIITAANEIVYRNGSAVSDIQNFSSALYIKPKAVFRSKVIRDANEVIIGVSFVQR